MDGRWRGTAPGAVRMNEVGSYLQTTMSRRWYMWTRSGCAAGECEEMVSSPSRSIHARSSGVTRIRAMTHSMRMGRVWWVEAARTWASIGGGVGR